MMILKKIKPLANRVLITMELLEEKDLKIGNTNLIDASKMKYTVKEFQKVVSCGTFVKGVKEGDVICFDPTRYGIKEHKEGSLKDGILTHNAIEKFDFSRDIIELDGVPHLLIYDNDIKYVVEDYEEFDENPTIITPEPKLIVE